MDSPGDDAAHFKIPKLLDWHLLRYIRTGTSDFPSFSQTVQRDIMLAAMKTAADTGQRQRTEVRESKAARYA